MSLIKCGNCGRLVSDQIANCPGCGAPISAGVMPPANESTQMATDVQPYAPQQPQQVYQPQQPEPYYDPYQPTSQPSKGNGLKITLIALIAALVAMLVGGGVMYYMNSKEKSHKAELQAYEDSLKQNYQQQLQESESARIEAEKAKEKAEAAKKKAESYRSGVVVNGVHVRLRYGPGLEYSIYPNDYNPIYPKKGTVLTYLGDYGDWYQVSYNGETLYISKQFSYYQ